MDARARTRAIEFLSAIEDACAERIVTCAGAHALLDSRHPRLWSANHLLVEDGASPDVATVVAAAEEQFGALEFRMIAAREEAVARALADPLAALGYEADHELLMVFNGQAAPTTPGVTITELESEQLTQTRVESAVERGRDPQVGRELTSRDRLVATVVAVRAFAVLEQGEVVARCQLYADRDIAQVENVYTRPSHRRRGLARALVNHAVREAHAGGAQLVFLIADANDWPQRLYRDLGFRDAGLMYRFRRELPR